MFLDMLEVEMEENEQIEEIFFKIKDSGIPLHHSSLTPLICHL